MNKLKEEPGNESAKKTDEDGMVMQKSHLRHGRCDCLIVFKLLGKRHANKRRQQ
jgi:hypothetical protein